jgi:anaerobic ribonucleoside-triphosphate reductase
MMNASTESTVKLKDEERTRCEVWTRVMGYHRPVLAWNPGKQSEHAERLYFVEPAAQQGRGPRA